MGGVRLSHPADLLRKESLKAPNANAKLGVPIHRLEREPEPKNLHGRIVAEGS